MNTQTEPKSIVLIGFMGTGKTTAGELAAIKLKRKFIDIDDEIEKGFGLPTTEIFKNHGEKAFRTYEKQVIQSACSEKNKVISLGGGAFMNRETREFCLENCTVFFLDISWVAWKKRFDLLIDSRPVLQGRDINEIKEIYEERKKIYAHHHFTILVDDLSPDEVANQIRETINTSG